jgi:hypothetical protein
VVNRIFYYLSLIVSGISDVGRSELLMVESINPEGASKIGVGIGEMISGGIGIGRSKLMMMESRTESEWSILKRYYSKGKSADSTPQLY